MNEKSNINFSIGKYWFVQFLFYCHRNNLSSIIEIYQWKNEIVITDTQKFIFIGSSFSLKKKNLQKLIENLHMPPKRIEACDRSG